MPGPSLDSSTSQIIATSPPATVDDKQPFQVTRRAEVSTAGSLSTRLQGPHVLPSMSILINTSLRLFSATWHPDSSSLDGHFDAHCIGRERFRGTQRNWACFLLCPKWSVLEQVSVTPKSPGLSPGAAFSLTEFSSAHAPPRTVRLDARNKLSISIGNGAAFFRLPFGNATIK
ncbi:hypothetical protein CC78DRAFT_581160 [Lojkania enalia]|uniref:Uncharacterized protein n=1 Tax=Lojkania enalia TaxID=147567 RepID=A0A9P4N852_9PLEO|nr:hypothetical protein CC78DRAFT_581160 [Didymosphaeria enalia]